MERKAEDFCSCEKLYYLKIFDRKCLVGTKCHHVNSSLVNNYIIYYGYNYTNYTYCKALYTYVQQINYTRGEVTLKEFSQTFFCADIADIHWTFWLMSDTF